MSTSTPPPPQASDTSSRTPRVAGRIMFAGLILIVLGVCQALQSISMLARDPLFGGRENVSYLFDVSGWAWLYLIMGLVVAGLGVAVVQGRRWACVVAIYL